MATLAFECVALLAVSALCGIAGNRLGARMTIAMNAAISQRLYHSGLVRGSGLEGQELATLVTEGAPAASGYFTGYLPTLMGALLMIPISGAVIGFINGWSALSIIVAMIALPPAANMMRRKNIGVQMRQLSAYDHTGREFEESLRGLTTLKIFAADKRTSDSLRARSEGFRVATMNLLSGQLRSLIGSDIVIAVSTVTAVTAAAITSPRGTGTGGIMTIVYVAIASMLLFAPERQLVYLSHSAAVAMRRGKLIAAAIGTDGGTADDAHASPSETADDTGLGPQNAGGRRTIEISHLSLDYSPSIQALRNISFSTGATGHVAIVGTSGSGKSTLLSVLTRSSGTYRGTVRINGTDILTVDPHRLRSLQTVVTGRDPLFRGTLRSNLDPASVGYDDSRLSDAIREVGLENDPAFRRGLDTRIEFQGANLSGGQRQRVCIARALLRHTPLYLFDEATSAVDREHDRQLSDAMKRLSRHALVISVSHRLATVREADRIMVMDRGSLVEQGTFDELMAEKGLFAREWNTQENIESPGLNADAGKDLAS
jgi:ATP-binding cassette subfamily B protein